MKLFRLSGFKVAMLLTVGLLVVFYFDRIRPQQWTEILRLIEYKAYDFRFKMRGTRQPGNDIAVLAIDEKSIDELGRFPWPRKTFAKAIDNLNEDGAAVVAFDVIFSEPDPADADVQRLWDLTASYERAGLQSPQVIPDSVTERLESVLAQLSGKEAAARGQLSILQSEILSSVQTYQQASQGFYKELSGAAVGRNDEAFAEAVRKFPGAVLGYFFFRDQAEVEGLTESEYKRGSELITSSSILVKQLASQGITEPYPFALIDSAIGLRANIKSLAEASPYHGYFNATLDPDGVIRHYETVIRNDDQLYPALAVQAVNVFYGRTNPEAAEGIFLEYEPGVGATDLRVGGQHIPVDERGQLLINYYGPKKMFPHYSFTDVVNKRFPPGTFKDKLLFVGSTAIAVYDLRTTPFQEAYPGVEMHATVANNILNSEFMQPTDFLLLTSEALLILALGLVLGIFVPRVRALLGAAVSVAILIGIYAANFALFESGYWFSIVYPTLALIGIYGGITIYRYATEEKEKKQIKSAFGLYLHPAMVDQLAEHPDSLRLGGERRNLTAFFSDIAGFSTFSEQMQPEDLVTFLNEYLTEMTDILQGYEATVDKYIGDAIVAFYGAPLPFNDHAVKACMSAIDTQAKLNELRQKWAAQGLPQVRMRIGLNTGPMVVGNMGSQNRFNYTMMGDSVNLAARLESGAKQYGVYTMIGEQTEKEARAAVETRWLDYIVVKGRTKPVNIFELLGKKGQIDKVWDDVREHWQLGVDAYRGRQFDLAITHFQEVLRVRPDDGPSKVYLGRCQNYKAAPPPENWDGVFVATSK